jgi:energy-coupling factor transporter transmembrane protein EcfT
LLRRPGYEIDVENILKACARKGVAVEINANSWRLDLDWRWHRMALDLAARKSRIELQPRTKACGYYRERWYIAILTTIGIAVHISHVPITLGLIVLVLFLQRKFAPAHIRLSRLALLVLPLFIAVGSMLAVNWYHSRVLSLAKNGNVFLLAKWADEGPALSYLEQSCPTVKYELCAYFGGMRGLTHDDLKWREDSPFTKVGSSLDELEPEARRIVWGTLKTYPVEIFYRSMKDAGRQILRFQAGDGLTPGYARLVAPTLGEVFSPAVERSVLESKQGQGRLPIAEFRLLHMVGVIFGLILCLWSFSHGGDCFPHG